MIIMMDPPEHDRFRALVSRVFTPAGGHRARADDPRGHRRTCLDPLAERDEFDVVADFSAPFPVEIISRMLGVPEGERQQIRHWLDLTLHREPGEMDPTPRGHGRHARAGRLLLRARQARSAGTPATTCSPGSPRSPSTGATASETGLDDDEIAGFATLLGGAGAETVTKLVGNAVVLFDAAPRPVAEGRRRPGAHPGRGRGDPALPAAVAVPGPVLRRGPRPSRAAPSPPAIPVLLLTGAATRDPRAFDRPDDFDIDRPPAVAIGFGHGVHSCLGAALARMESRIAIEELARALVAASRSTSPASAGCTCRTSPATGPCPSRRALTA